MRKVPPLSQLDAGGEMEGRGSPGVLLRRGREHQSPEIDYLIIVTG